MKERIIQDLKDWRRSLQRLKREAERDGDYLIDWRPWVKGKRTHVAAVDAWIKNAEWLLKECRRREAKKDAAFFEALEIAKIGVALDWSDRMEVSAPALEAYQRQRNKQRSINASKALKEEERTQVTKLCAEFWRRRPRATKAAMLKWVTERADIAVPFLSKREAAEGLTEEEMKKRKARRVRTYLDKLPVPYLGNDS